MHPRTRQLLSGCVSCCNSVAGRQVGAARNVSKACSEYDRLVSNHVLCTGCRLIRICNPCGGSRMGAADTRGVRPSACPCGIVGQRCVSVYDHSRKAPKAVGCTHDAKESSARFAPSEYSTPPIGRNDDSALMIFIDLGLVLIYTSVLLIKACDASAEVCAAYGLGSTSDGDAVGLQLIDSWMLR
jgi:hypothetical protein|eukprot:5078420-Prymnesium_polylepis.1